MFLTFKKPKVNTNTLIEQSKEITALCIDNSTADEFHPIFHHLPLKSTDKHYMEQDNWDLTEEQIAMVNKNLEKLTAYACRIFKEYAIPCAEFILDKEPVVFTEELLPRWIVFPLYPANSLGWRMGIGEDYTHIFRQYYDSLSEEEKKKYREKYPIPHYMIPPFVGTGLSKEERDKVIDNIY